ncbi:MAG: hypothetical protein V1494_01960 [Candidatus Diapherotrites archaeon]
MRQMRYRKKATCAKKTTINKTMLNAQHGAAVKMNAVFGIIKQAGKEGQKITTKEIRRILQEKGIAASDKSISGYLLVFKDSNLAPETKAAMSAIHSAGGKNAAGKKLSSAYPKKVTAKKLIGLYEKFLARKQTDVAAYYRTCLESFQMVVPSGDSLKVIPLARNRFGSFVSGFNRSSAEELDINQLSDAFDAYFKSQKNQ